MIESAYILLLGALLLVSGASHILAPEVCERWLSREPVIRAIGLLLLLLALPSLAWRGWYFRTLFAGLAISGAWRLCFPQSSIRAQRWSYPRWVHGCIMIGGAVLLWALRP